MRLIRWLFVSGFPGCKGSAATPVGGLLSLLSVLLLIPEAAMAYDPVAEEANCRRAHALSEQTSLRVLKFWDQLSQHTFGKPQAELSPAELMRLSQVVDRMENTAGATVIPQAPALQKPLDDRCSAYGAWRAEHENLATAVRQHIAGSSDLIGRWGQERILGIGCFCPGYVLGDENSENKCHVVSPDLCRGRSGRRFQPDVSRGCRSVVASDWLIRQELPMMRTLGLPEFLEPVRDATTVSKTLQPVPNQCLNSRTPMVDLAFPSLASRAVAGSGAALAEAIGPGARCYAQSEPGICRQAADQAVNLVAAAARARNRTCLAYAMVAQSVWTIAANPDYTYLLTDYPEASRLRNDARIAMRYLRMNCRKV